MSFKRDPLYKHIEKVISDEIKKESLFVSQGKCETFDAYKNKSGVIKGLELSLELITESFKKYLSEDIDDD
jgi:hypothetical protein